MTWRVVVGTLLVVATIVMIAFTAVNEPARMAEFEQGFQARSIEAGAALFDTNCKGCHGPQGRGIPGVAPALNTREMFDGTRLEGIGWSGTLEDYIKGTTSSGRPIPSIGTGYAQRMPTWSEEFGGPLRTDQIRNIVDFIMNWESTALEGAARELEPEPAEPTPAAAAEPATAPVGAELGVELPEGDPANGETLFKNTYPCAACHSLEPDQVIAGPSLAGIAARAAERIPDYDAQTYLYESIVQPDAFVVEDFINLMPPNFGDQMTAQDLADIIAFLLTQE